MKDYINEMIDFQMKKSFKLDKLNEGDMSQLDNWINSDGMSIFIEWVPDQLNEQTAIEFFSKLGEVENIRFLDKVTDKGKKRSVYVNFIEWNRDSEDKVHPDIVSIASAFPGYYSLPIDLYVDKNRTVLRTFQLKSRVNRSLPKEKVPKERGTKEKVPKERGTKERGTKERGTKERGQITPHLLSNEERIFHLEQQVSLLWYEINVLKSSFMPCPRF